VARAAATARLNNAATHGNYDGMGDLLWLLLPNSVHLLLLLALVVVAIGRSGAHHVARWRWPARVALLMVWGLTTPAVANWIVRSLEGPLEPPPAAEADDRTRILVLASGQLHANDGSVVARLDVHGWERAEAGVDLWRRTGGMLIFSGGPQGDPAASLAASMASVARRMGVPSTALLQSPVGSNTFEEMAGAKPLMAGDGPRWLVTSASHLPRSMQVATCLGQKLKPYSVAPQQIVNLTWRSWLPDPQAPQVFRQALHEWLGMAYYRIRHGC
jgi:uncharacterized SAM-binding protein YcdF (DUF218 family)